MSETKERAEKKAKHPGGRPKITFTPWDNWEKDICDLYGEGASDVEVRALIAEKMENTDSCSWGLWDRWLKEEPQFLKTIKKGRGICEVWWQKEGRKSLRDPAFSSTLWYMNMKNRFGWADKQEINAEVKQNVSDVSDEDLNAKIEQLKKELEG